MNKTILKSSHILVFLMAGLLLAEPAFAEKPSWAGHKNKDEHGDYRGDRDDDRGHDTDINVNVYFGDQQRVVVHDYYEERSHSGHCPPGLAKKQNGCMPPGQAKKWRRGYPLPRDVIFYDLPPRIVVELGPPPPRHRYVRVAADILLIAIGTGIVVDAIEDLGNM